MKAARIRRALDALLGPEPTPEISMEAYPPPYPSGWYRICRSDELARGQMLVKHCLGQELLVFRGRDNGEAAVVDAHCPHQGANLAVGGAVVGDTIRCPFHHWAYDTTGRLCSIPDVDTPPRVSLGVWPTVERHGVVWMYFDAHQPRAAAPYALETPEDLVAGELVHRGDHCAGEVAMHIIEFAENSADFQHFHPVHGDMLIPWTSARVPFIKVQHTPSWEPDADRPHVAYFRNDAILQIGGRTIPRSSAHAEITFFGPGSVVWFRFMIPDVGEILLFQTHTPLAPRRQKVDFRWYAQPQIPRLLVSYVVGSWISNWREDIAIWENKVYQAKPKLCRADGPVKKMRRWYEQFYAEDVAPAA